MATHLDLEEQEQLDQLKHFWNTYGTLITWVVLLVAGAFVAWNGWQYFQRNKAAQAAALYDEVERSTQSGDVERIQRVLGDMKERFAGTAYAQQAGLLAAKTLYEKGKVEESRAALGWVAQSAVDPGYQAIAKLRLAAELLDGKSYDEALKQLDGNVPKEFEPLVADRKGDIYMARASATRRSRIPQGLDGPRRHLRLPPPGRDQAQRGRRRPEEPGADHHRHTRSPQNS
jgi:predicted negative regulator of RcsB-dependent stress response